MFTGGFSSCGGLGGVPVRDDARWSGSCFDCGPSFVSELMMSLLRALLVELSALISSGDVCGKSLFGDRFIAVVVTDSIISLLLLLLLSVAEKEEVSFSCSTGTNDDISLADDEIVEEFTMSLTLDTDESDEVVERGSAIGPVDDFIS